MSSLRRCSHPPSAHVQDPATAPCNNTRLALLDQVTVSKHEHQQQQQRQQLSIASVTPSSRSLARSLSLSIGLPSFLPVKQKQKLSQSPPTEWKLVKQPLMPRALNLEESSFLPSFFFLPSSFSFLLLPSSLFTSPALPDSLTACQPHYTARAQSIPTPAGGQQSSNMAVKCQAPL